MVLFICGLYSNSVAGFYWRGLEFVLWWFYYLAFCKFVRLCLVGLVLLLHLLIWVLGIVLDVVDFGLGVIWLFVIWLFCTCVFGLIVCLYCVFICYSWWCFFGLFVIGLLYVRRCVVLFLFELYWYYLFLCLGLIFCLCCY